MPKEPGSIACSYLKTVIGADGRPEVIRVFEFVPFPKTSAEQRPQPKQLKNDRARHSS